MFAENQSNAFYQRRFPEAPVKINAKVDMIELRARAADPKKHMYLFRASALTADLGDKHLKLPDMGIGYFMSSHLASATGRPAQTSLLNQDTAVPVNYALNGLMAENPTEAMNMIEPGGVIEMGNADNTDSVVNLLRGGGIDIIYNCPRPSRLNAFLQVSVPTVDEAKAMKSPVVAQALGTDGVTGLMVSEFNPHLMDYLSPEGFRYYLTTPTPGNPDTRHPIMKNAVYGMLDRLTEFHNAILDATNPGVGNRLPVRTQDDIKNFAYGVGTLHDLVHRASNYKNLNEKLIEPLNGSVQHMGGVKLHREKWVMFHGQQCGINGSILPVSCINYGM